MNRAQIHRLRKLGVDFSDPELDLTAVKVEQLSPCAGCGKDEFASVEAGSALCVTCGRKRVWGEVTVSAYLFYQDGVPQMVFDAPGLNDEAKDLLATWIDAWQRHQIGILRDLRDKGIDAVSAGIRNAVRVQARRGRV